MGYPMSWPRFLSRNRLRSKPDADQYTPRDQWLLSGPSYMNEQDHIRSKQSLIVGDLHRVETDQRDERHLAWYAEQTGLTPEQVKSVLDLLFDHDSWCGKDWYP